MTPGDGGPASPSHEGMDCPRCHTPLAVTADPDSPVVTCPTCGHAMARTYLAERASLTRWRDWAGERLDWLDDRILAGDLPGPPGRTVDVVGPGHPGTAGPAPDHHPPSSAGTLLLAAGGLLLVLAGIAFVAFAWDLLGPFGQVATLYVIGGACLGATVPVGRRLPGTATTIGIVGALIVATASVAARVMGEDVIGRRPSLVLAVLALLALLAAGVWLRPRRMAVGEVASALGAAIAMVLVASAPADGSLPLDDPWSWWTFLVLTGASLGLLLAAARFAMHSWPPLAAASLGFAAIALAVYVSEVIDPADSDADWLAQAVVYLVSAVAVLVLYGVLRRYRIQLLVLTAFLFLLSFGTAVASATTPSLRPAAALVLAAIGLTLAASHSAATRLGASADVFGPYGHRITVLVGGAVIGVGFGYLVAPWTDWSFDTYTTVVALEWLDEAWPPWRGAVAGLTFALVLGVSGYLADRSSSFQPLRHTWAWGLLPLATVGAALFAWTVAAFDDPSAARYTIGWAIWGELVDTIQQQVAIAYSITGVAMFVLALLRRLPPAAVWIGALGLDVAALLVLEPADLRADVTPEIYAISLLLPTAAAGLGWWWLHRPARTTSWLTFAPAATVALLPSIMSLLDDATSRWFESIEPATAYQVRMVAVLLVGVALTVVGARQRIAGLLFPGLLAVLAVASIQLIELGRFLPQWVSFAVAGAVLVAAGARWEAVRRLGGRGTVWVRQLH
jgi:hypothetical protein